MNEDRILDIIINSINEKKGVNSVLLDLRKITEISDYFIITEALNAIHSQAISDLIQDNLFEHNIKPLRIEGYREGKWILLDYGFIVIHIMGKEERDFYRLEQLWHGAKVISSTFA